MSAKKIDMIVKSVNLTAGQRDKLIRIGNKTAESASAIIRRLIEAAKE